MHAISIWQPWATLIAIGAKSIETRNWSTPYRGPIVIHAATKWDRHLAGVCREHLIRNLLGQARELGHLCDPAHDDAEPCPRGCVLAVAKLVDCEPVEHLLAEGISETEQRLGDFSPGRYGWRLAEVRPLAEPIPARGLPGLWQWSPQQKLQFDTCQPVDPELRIRQCRICGCSERNACWNEETGGCHWVEADLCSECKT